MTFAREDLPKILEIEADRFQNLTYTEEDFKTEARAVLGEYNKNSADPTQQAGRGAARARPSRRTPTSTRRWASCNDIEDMPNQYEYSKEFFDRWYRPENTTIIVAGDVKPSDVDAARREVLGRLEARQLHRRRSRRAAAQAAGRRARRRGRRDTLPLGDRRVSRPGLLDRVEGLRRGRHAARPDVRRDLASSTSAWSRTSRRSTSSSPTTRRPSTRTLSTVFARVKNAAGRGLRARRDPARPCADARTTPAAGAAARRRASRTTATASLRTLDNTESIAGTLARYVRVRALVRHARHGYYRRLRVTHASGSAGRRAASISPTRGWCVTTLSKDPLPAAIQPRASPWRRSPPAPSQHCVRSASCVPGRSLPQLQREAAVHGRLGARPERQGGTGGAGRVDDRRGGLEGHAHRRDQRRRCSRWPASFDAQVDKEMTTFTGSRPQGQLATRSAAIALRMLLEPGLPRGGLQAPQGRSS